MKRRTISLVIILIMSIVGIFSSVHLAQMHYKKPMNQLTLLNTLPFLEGFIDKAAVEKVVKDEKLKELEKATKELDKSPTDDPNFDPYANVMTEDQAKKIKAGKEENKEACDINGTISCTAVDESKYSEIGGIAVSLYGLAGYIIMTLLSLICLVKKDSKIGILQYILIGGAKIGLLFSIYLTYLEAVKIKAYCPYCLASAGAMVVIFICVVIGYGIDIMKSLGKKAAPAAEEK